MNKLLLFIFLSSACYAADRTFSTACVECRRPIKRQVPLSIVTNKFWEIVTAPDSGCTNYQISMVLVCERHHTNTYRFDKVVCVPRATEDIEITPPKEIPENIPAPLPTTNTVATNVTIHILSDGQTIVVPKKSAE